MNTKTLLSVLTLTTVLGASLALPTTVSAHEVVREKRVEVIRDITHRDHHRGDAGRWYAQRHREATGHWAPPRHRRKHCKHRNKHGHRHHRPHARYERRYEQRIPRPVVRHRDHHDRDALRIRIGYDVVL
jgi:hypothetical protein